MATTTAEAIGLPFEEAIDYFRQKIRVPTEHWDDLWKEAHARGFMVAGATSDGLLKDFQQAIQKALDHGTTLAEFRGDFDRIVKTHGWEHTGTPGWRAQIIYETNLSMAYSAGRYAQQTDPDTLRHFPYWQYRHSGSRHPRLMHLAWDGLTLKADDPWWDAHYPPNGWHCGCRVSIVSEGGLRRMGKTGPDASPGTLTQPWTNPRTGETRQVAVGCDPGFDYNPGKAWKEGRAAALPVRAPNLRPGIPGEPQPSDKQLDALRRFIAQPEGEHPLGRPAEALRTGLGGATETMLPAETVARAKARGVTEEELLLLPLLVGEPTAAAIGAGGVTAAVPIGGEMLAGLLDAKDGVARVNALRKLTPAALARLIEAGITLIGGG